MCHPECRECNPLQTEKVIGVNYFSSAAINANIYFERLNLKSYSQ